MTFEQIEAIIESVVLEVVANSGIQANIPIITGRLRSAIKVRKGGIGITEIYMDDGAMSVDEWEELDKATQDSMPFGFAPYAGEVNARNPYFQRVGYLLYTQLRIALNPNGGSPFEREPQRRGDQS